MERIRVCNREGLTCSQVLKSSAGLPSRSTRAGPLGCVPILSPQPEGRHQYRHRHDHHNGIAKRTRTLRRWPCRPRRRSDPPHPASQTVACVRSFVPTAKRQRHIQRRTCSCATVLSRPNLPQAYCCTTLWSSGMTALSLSLSRQAKRRMSMRPHEPHRGSVLDSPGSSRTDERISKAWQSSSCECEQ